MILAILPIICNLLVVFLLLYPLGYLTRKLTFGDDKLDWIEDLSMDLGVGFLVLSLSGFILNHTVGITSFYSAAYYLFYLGFCSFTYLFMRHSKVKLLYVFRNAKSIFKSPRILLFLIISVVIFIFSGLVKLIVISEYPVPPGDDEYLYAYLANNILRKRSLDLTYGSLDGVGLPIFSAMVAAITGMNVIDLFKPLGPFLLFLSTLAIYTFVKDSFGVSAGLFSSFLYGVVALSPLYTLWEGTYTVLIANSLMTLGFRFLLRIFRHAGRHNAIAAGILLSGVLFFNVIISVIMLVAASLVSLTFLIRDSMRNKKHFFDEIRLLLITFSIILICGLFLVTFSYLGSYAYSLLTVITGKGSMASEIGGTQQPMSLSEYPEYLGVAFFYFGMLSFFFLTLGLILKSYKTNANSLLFTLIWIVIVFLLSRTPWSIVPVRFARELTLPLAIDSGIFVSRILNLEHKQLIIHAHVKRVIIKPVKVALLLTFMLFPVTAFMVQLNTYNDVMFMKPNRLVRVDPSIYDAMMWLKDQPNGVVLSSPFVDLPTGVLSNKQIIMPGVQPKDFVYRLSYADRNITYRLWHILDNPNCGESLSLIKHFNVSYIFILKERPHYWGPAYAVNVDWNTFVYSKLYQVIFQNEKVAIFRLSPLGQKIASFISSYFVSVPLMNLPLSWNISEGEGSVTMHEGEGLIEANLKYEAGRSWMGVDMHKVMNLSAFQAFSFWFKSNTSTLNGASPYTTYQFVIFDELGRYRYWRFKYSFNDTWEKFIFLTDIYSGQSDVPPDLARISSLRFEFTDWSDSSLTYSFWIHDIRGIRFNETYMPSGRFQ